MVIKNERYVADSLKLCRKSLAEGRKPVELTALGRNPPKSDR
jgi:hypothetical protein